jgi:hypothetical protein
MPSPSTSLATLRPDIAAAFIEFELEAEAQGYIASQVLPAFDVQYAAGTYPIIPIETLLQNPETKRNNNSGYNRMDWNFDDATYRCDEHGLEGPVDDRTARMYKEYFDAEVQTSLILRAAIMRAAEKRVAAKLFNATTFTSQTTSVTNEWDSNHTSNATPIANVNTAVNAVYDRTGVWPNALIINRKVFKNLKMLDEIIAAIASSGAGDPTKQADITAQMLAQVFDLDMVIVAGGSKNTADEGQTVAVEQVWSNEYAMVAKVARTNNFGEPCIGRILHYSDDGSTIGGTVEQYRDEHLRRDVLRVRHDVDEKILYTEIAQLLDNVTTI